MQITPAHPFCLVHTHCHILTNIRCHIDKPEQRKYILQINNLKKLLKCITSYLVVKGCFLCAAILKFQTQITVHASQEHLILKAPRGTSQNVI